jgi:regulation of enolase protein 1 (concanavalin A-like superfamily)
MNVIAFPMKLPLFALAFTLVALPGTPVAAADTPEVLFEENFAGKLGAGWQWLRERPEAWRIADGSLILDTLPGSYWQKQNSGQNTLLRKAPASLQEGFIIEVHLDNAPKGQWEHAGILCYFDGETFVALNKEFTGKQCIFVFSQQDGKPTKGEPETEYKESGVWLRLTLRGTKATAQFRSSEKEPWQAIGKCPIPTSAKELLVGFQSGYGQEKSGRQARFSHFRILKAE